ncbi:RNA-binding family protein [Perilla frutescens var. hirtella]|nr:RNA-binding family protein [Perilla frutescens var. hirtella]
MPSTWSPPHIYRTGGTAASPPVPRSVVRKHGIKKGGPARVIPKIENRENKATVLYIRRIPHGFFYEIEMEAFFKQIGTVRRFEVVRNRKAGKSKHFEFIEFQSPKVAKVGEECMHNHLIPEASKMLASPPSTCMQRDFGQSREAQRRRPTLLSETAKINGVSDCRKIQKGREIARRKEINSHKQQAFTIISESELTTLLPPIPAARFQLTRKLPSLLTVKFKHKNKPSSAARQVSSKSTVSDSSAFNSSSPHVLAKWNHQQQLKTKTGSKGWEENEAWLLFCLKMVENG